MAVIKISFCSECLSRMVDVTAIIPLETPLMPGMKPEDIKPAPDKFKTLYLLHGYSGNQDDWITFSNIRSIAEEHKLAVIMPSGENSFYTDSDTLGNKYGTYIAKELIEFTRKMFPLSNKREDTFIGGLSMGGFGALRLGALYDDTFSKIISLSGAFVTENLQNDNNFYSYMIGNNNYFEQVFGNLNNLQNSENNPIFCVKKAKNMPEVYMACGCNDFLIKENKSVKKQLENENVKLYYTETDGIHDWSFWNSQIPLAIKWLLSKNN